MKKLIGMLVAFLMLDGLAFDAEKDRPTPRGDFDDWAVDQLAAIGCWMKRNSRSVYGYTAPPEEFKTPVGTLLTYNHSARRRHRLSGLFCFADVEAKC